MADCRRYLPAQHLDLQQIIQEAQHRWLRPTEICEILRNYQKFNLTPEPPSRPPAGSLFLFDRKALRYFRKDGHRWRKKRDGKTVKEAHEKLKAGSVDVLHCYYAHGEENENFQRRSYWMLDRELEHIVLVHYREVKEGYKSGISRLLVDQGPPIISSQTSSAGCFALANSPASTAQTSYVSSVDRVDRSEQTISSDLEDVDSLGSLGASLTKSAYRCATHDTYQFSGDPAGLPASSTYQTSSWFSGGTYNFNTRVPISAKISCRNVDSSCNQEFQVDNKFTVKQVVVTDFVAHRLTESKLDADSGVLDTTSGSRLQGVSELQDVAVTSQCQMTAENHSLAMKPQNTSTSTAHIGSTSSGGEKNNEEAGELRKLDSFGRWMDKEIGQDCDDSLMASDSGNYWNALPSENDDKEVSSLSHHLQLDTDSLGPSLSQEQLFSISDYSPDWAYSDIETKVLVVGTFLGSKKLSADMKWGCMFGEIEVSAEILTDSSMRCVAPAHAPGRVPFYVTCSNRLACSEVREFEYREMPSMPSNIAPEDEVCLQSRLAKLLYLDPVAMQLGCSVEACDKCKLKNFTSSTDTIGKFDIGRVEEASTSTMFDCPYTRDLALQCLLEDKLAQWLVCKLHEGGRGPNILDTQGQGVIHLAAALGYEWAISRIIAAGVNPNFRDARGRTALHWASYCGREETVIALVGHGAAPGVVDDPKPACPGGQTAADLASSRGHKGIAAYLAEADLTSHLSLLTVNEKVMDSFLETLVAEKATEGATPLVSTAAKEEERCMKDSLAAVRKSTHAAAMIQAAFRARSFQQRQLIRGNSDASEVLADLIAIGSFNRVKSLGHYEDYLHSAATKIQKKYRGWKGRKDFLKIRNRIVKVQAHVRGHQIRKQYKKFVRSVSIMEKAILRWRRKRTGLRAFQVEKRGVDDHGGDEKTDEYDFLRISRKQKFDGVERALARVKSMVRDPKARDQYMRLVQKFDNFKMVNKGRL
ncbi:calmodulin-binding transcription activator 3-like isoform X1 [Rhodamnia argentea]|uniref:Calmodulin-binding transcription activator 3-like isoform X1 n=1 Tax=Rhodamnia argentea TaxID=178133 RepID=A0A8B8PWY8_9MYRT|nr:calmodulin-binding transcription activator 3-like isoform X1 [Rhodamnia argentea]